MGRQRMHPKLAKENGTLDRNPARYKNTPPEGVDRAPEMPAVVAACPVAVAVWNDTCKALDEIGILSASDVFILEMYCTSYAEYLKLTEVVRKEGFTVDNRSGKAANPNANAWEKAKSSVLRCMAQLGLTPAARAKLNGPGKDDDLSDADKMCKELGI